jgi:hypothetical protein
MALATPIGRRSLASCTAAGAWPVVMSSWPAVVRKSRKAS